MADLTNTQLINTGHLDDAESLMHAVGELLPAAQDYTPDDRDEAYREVVDNLAKAVDGLTILLRQVTDGLLDPDRREWAEMK